MHVVVSGGSGFVGTRLGSGLIARGHQVTVLTRDASRSRDHLHPKVAVASWAAGAEWEHVVDGAGAVVNLAGESLAKRWTEKTKERIVASRVGALEKMLPPFRAGLGGPLGNGKQWISWIHADDLVSLLVLALESPAATGAINAVAPAPVRMNDFAKALARALHRPAFLRVPAPVLKTLLGEMSAVVLHAQRVLPPRAEALAFTFKHREIAEALRSTLS